MLRQLLSGDQKSQENTTSGESSNFQKSCVFCFFGTHVVILVVWKFVVFDCWLLFFCLFFVCVCVFFGSVVIDSCVVLCGASSICWV